MLLRIILAAIAVVLFIALIQPVGRLLHFPLTGDLLTVITICVAGIAVYYVITGHKPV